MRQHIDEGVLGIWRVRRNRVEDALHPFLLEQLRLAFTHPLNECIELSGVRGIPPDLEHARGALRVGAHAARPNTDAECGQHFAVETLGMVG